ncbi:MAG: transglycosylase SLT domain-containing protein [Melioribacteraceae bacterium]|nr:transglycosylase SLT domain-containing protein [Melioribacteraceae bacterium]
MEEVTLKASNDKHFIKPIEIKSRYDENQKEKIAKASKQFESVLTAMMLKSMNKTTGGLFGDEEGYGNDMFDTIFEQEIAQKMSATKSLGIAEILYRKITGENMPDELKFKLSSKINPIKANNVVVPADATKVKPSNSSLERIDKFEKHIEEASKTFGVDKAIIKSVILAESAGNHKAVSSAKAKGLMQLIDSTAADMGVKNVFNPKENIFGGTKYLAQMLRQYSGDLKLALAAYNAGPQNVEKYKGVPPFAETKSYINKVLSYLEHFSENES